MSEPNSQDKSKTGNEVSVKPSKETQSPDLRHVIKGDVKKVEVK